MSSMLYYTRSLEIIQISRKCKYILNIIFYILYILYIINILSSNLATFIIGFFQKRSFTQRIFILFDLIWNKKSPLFRMYYDFNAIGLLVV